MHLATIVAHHRILHRTGTTREQRTRSDLSSIRGIPVPSVDGFDRTDVHPVGPCSTGDRLGRGAERPRERGRVVDGVRGLGFDPGCVGHNDARAQRVRFVDDERRRFEDARGDDECLGARDVREGGGVVELAGEGGLEVSVSGDGLGPGVLGAVADDGDGEVGRENLEELGDAFGFDEPGGDDGSDSCFGFDIGEDGWWVGDVVDMFHVEQFGEQ